MEGVDDSDENYCGSSSVVDLIGEAAKSACEIDRGCCFHHCFLDEQYCCCYFHQANCELPKVMMMCTAFAGQCRGVELGAEIEITPLMQA